MRALAAPTGTLASVTSVPAGRGRPSRPHPSSDTVRVPTATAATVEPSGTGTSRSGRWETTVPSMRTRVGLENRSTSPATCGVRIAAARARWPDEVLPAREQLDGLRGGTGVHGGHRPDHGVVGDLRGIQDGREVGVGVLAFNGMTALAVPTVPITAEAAAGSWATERARSYSRTEALDPSPTCQSSRGPSTLA